ncbi:MULTISPECIES: hypothetical protein [Lactiplantibacillus]|uniref:hypothetical protein n=1 Tax=Lactiplantibacillus TaxID=2767842 RepID=UPI001C1FCEC3|nr:MULTISPECIES: hypothetical protein [Lactiplantibacillus]MBU7448915.1 hypothetical protein [Lactiplantibacillus sp. 7.2.4]MBU7481682.1 hypothetical protein [Lactiplantibacillus pentosus]MBU7504306.1 hypothetical protein [Lactiplantibacillus pentosus]MDY1545644.1 hypothetical protein [Lactiplantibacillus pentosus]
MKVLNRHWQVIEWASTVVLVACTLGYQHQLLSKPWSLVIGSIALGCYWLVVLPRLFRRA